MSKPFVHNVDIKKITQIDCLTIVHDKMMARPDLLGVPLIDPDLVLFMDDSGKIDPQTVGFCRYH